MIRWEQTWLLVCFFSLELSGCSGSSSQSQGTTGGSNSVGGTSEEGSATGGAVAADTTRSSGGSSDTTATKSSTTNGGANALGGTTSSSGVNTTVSGTSGGSMPTGGARSAGGTASIAGASNAGGAKASGGSAAGGASSTASSKAAGGTVAGGSKATGGTVAGGSKATGGTGATGGSGTGGSLGTHVSVLQHHNHASRDGVYVDAALTKASVANLHIDTTFASATLSGPTYAQPLYLAANGSGPDLVIAVTEQNRVYAFNAATGALVYNVLLGHTLPQAQLASLASFCGNIDPLGITGTPIIDEATRTLYLDAMISADGTATNARHQVFALNADTGATLSGWPVDLNSKVPTTGGTSFNSLVQNQRGALALLGGKVFVPFGGHIGDCGSYHGWVVGISTADPTQVSAWATRAIAGGIWAPGGIASDGTSLFIVTGNTEANPNNFAPPSSWQDGEAIFRLAPSLAPVSQNADYYVPTNWSTMDQGDQDLGGANALVVDVPGATPSSLIVALGKDGKAYAVNRANLGGISAGTSVATVAGNAIITAPAAYATSSGSFVVFKGNGSGCPSGQSGGLTALKIGATSPPSISVAWCGGPSTNDSAAVSMSDAQGQDAIVWIVGSDNKLHGLDANTGTSVYAGGTGTDTMSTVQKFETPIVANGRVFVAANNQVYAFTP